MISEFPLFLFTTLTGVAAGAYFASAFFPKAREGKGAWLLPLLCVVLIGAGAVCAMFHLGHVDRVLNALSNPASMIAQEAIWSILTAGVALVDCIIMKAKGASPRAVGLVGAAVALVLMGVTANAYYTAFAVSEWTTPFTWLLFVAGDIAMGAALVGAFRPELYGESALFAGVFVVAAIATLAGMVGMASVFSGAECGMVPFVVGAVVGPVASTVIAFAAKAGKMPAGAAAGVALALCLVGVIVCRYFFYTASIL